MKPEFDRVKNDLDTIQKAIGLAPTVGRDWIRWLKRDTRLYLWWCIPGFMLMASALPVFDNTTRHWGLMTQQWMGLLVAAVMLGIGSVVNRQMAGSDGRPDGLVREYKRINRLGWVFLAPILFYFVWGKQYAIEGRAFMAGLWLLSGSMVFVAAMFSRVWVLLGWAIPILAFGLCQPMMRGRWGGAGLGTMFIAIALLCSFIQAFQLRGMQKQHDAH